MNSQVKELINTVRRRFDFAKIDKYNFLNSKAFYFTTLMDVLAPFKGSEDVDELIEEINKEFLRTKNN